MGHRILANCFVVHLSPSISLNLLGTRIPVVEGITVVIVGVGVRGSSANRLAPAGRRPGLEESRRSGVVEVVVFVVKVGGVIEVGVELPLRESTILPNVFLGAPEAVVAFV